MVVLAARVLGDPGWPGVGVAVRPVVIVQRHNDGQRLGHVDLRVLSPLRLAVQVAHRSGVALGQPVVQLGGMGRGTRSVIPHARNPSSRSPLLQRRSRGSRERRGRLGRPQGRAGHLRLLGNQPRATAVREYDQAHSSRDQDAVAEADQEKDVNEDPDRATPGIRRSAASRYRRLPGRVRSPRAWPRSQYCRSGSGTAGNRDERRSKCQPFVSGAGNQRLVRKIMTFRFPMPPAGLQEPESPMFFNSRVVPQTPPSFVKFSAALSR